MDTCSLCEEEPMGDEELSQCQCGVLLCFSCYSYHVKRCRWCIERHALYPHTSVWRMP